MCTYDSSTPSHYTIGLYEQASMYVCTCVCVCVYNICVCARVCVCVTVQAYMFGKGVESCPHSS